MLAEYLGQVGREDHPVAIDLVVVVISVGVDEVDHVREGRVGHVVDQPRRLFLHAGAQDAQERGNPA